ncbi:MAG: S8 family serine peptidase [Clostridia bacterium]|nr:S8 family serine peptidase [Clostridia bacterium]
MFSKILMSWKAECTDTKKLEFYRDNQKSSVEARFYIADHLLSIASSGKETASAVWMMEDVAKQDYAQAAFAMGQLFHHGWAVKQDNETAITWYEKALSLGYEEAKTAIEELREIKQTKTAEPKKETEKSVTDTKKEDKPKRKSKIIIAGIIVLCIALGFGAWWYFGIRDNASTNKDSGPQIIVNEDTELSEPVTAEEFANELVALKEKYDDEQVIRGERSTNRLILEFEGDMIDLSEFLADNVISRNGELIIIQFETEEEAKRCMEILKNMEGIVFVEEDKYIPNSIERTQSAVAPRPLASGNGYRSPYTGYTYNSWGIEDLGTDILAKYLIDNNYDDEIIVAVIDTGVEPNRYTEDYILKGIDMVDSSKQYGHVDEHGHGTHVSGTVLDVMRGLNVKILPIGVHAGGNSVSTSGAVSGIDYAREKGAKVINMSLGGPSDSSDVMYERAISRAVNAGVTVVVAAGNEADDASYYCPSNVEQCIVVAAHDINRHTADFSNYGECVDLSAAGVEVLSYVSSHSEDATEVEPGVFMTEMPGTSMASPHIAALAAMLKLYLPNAAPEQIENYIKDYCLVPPDGDVSDFGEGICNAELFLE